MTKRQEFSPRQKDEILQRNMKRFGFPVCEVPGCGVMLKRGQYQTDHIKACWEGGKATVENGRLICLPCHAEKSGEEGRIAQTADRKGRKDRGVRPKTSRPMPGSRASGIKKHMDGTVSRRNP
jgi:hypothetical protein